MNKWEMNREQMEQAIADKLNEIVDIFDGWHGHDASELSISIGKDKVWGYIYKENEKNPLDFMKERKARRATGRLFTEEVGDIIGKAAKECLFNNEDNPLCWASNEGVEMLRQKLVFRLQEHDFMLDLKENRSQIRIEKVGAEE